MSGQPSSACCSIPPVVAENYEAKGTYKPFGGLDKAYITGPEGTGKALVVIFDIFGYFPQTLQGADILAETVQARVVMPDFFRDEPMDIALYPPKTDEAKAAIAKFFKTKGAIPDRKPEVIATVQALRAEGYTKVGLIGYCWGAKLATVTAGDAESGLDAVASVHPAMVSAADAENLQVPIGLFASGDEDREECDKFFKGVSQKPFATKSVFVYYQDMFHGWAAARGNLKDPDNLKQYEDVYKRLSNFFKTTLA
ncbi:hypothetical protein FRB99_008228 [Tulasnella sp. 403]|nr:hypothetical protein FRB99_008228 [Tulasnella sp. 403]